MHLKSWRALYDVLYTPHIKGISGFDYAEDAMLGISVPGNWAGWQIPLRDANAIDELLIEQDAKGKDIYFRIPPLRNRRYGSSERGNAEDSLHMPALFLDLDTIGSLDEEAAHKPFTGKQAGLRHPTIEEALAMVEEVLPPTLVVSSGHGLHVYFSNMTPFLLKAGANGKIDRTSQYAQLLLRWDAFWAAESNKRGYGMDAGVSKDAARVLRVPGTHNRKIPGDIKPVKILKIDRQAVYTTEFLEGFIPELPKPEVRQRAASHRISSGDRKKGNTWATKVPVSYLMEELFGMECTSDQGTKRRWAFPHEDGHITPDTDHCTTYVVGEKQELELAYALGSRLQEAWCVDDHLTGLSSWDLLLLVLGGDRAEARLITSVFEEPNDELIEAIHGAREMLMSRAA